jgi:hypothetical protein
MVVVASVALMGCQPGGAPPAAPAGGGNVSYLDRAQTNLPTVKLWLGTRELTVEVARTPTQVATGMMFRTAMGEEEGMLFVFAAPHRAAFYMRNTLIPLSGAYMDPDGRILEIHEMKPKDERPIPAASDRIQFVLETRQGWFERHGVGVGTLVRTEKGSLQELLRRAIRP